MKNRRSPKAPAVPRVEPYAMRRRAVKRDAALLSLFPGRRDDRGLGDASAQSSRTERREIVPCSNPSTGKRAVDPAAAPAATSSGR